MSLYSHFFNHLHENTTPDDLQILGIVYRTSDKQGQLDTLDATEYDTIPDNWRQLERNDDAISWGYVPSIQQLSFFTKVPTPEEIKVIQNFLKTRNMTAKRFFVPKNRPSQLNEGQKVYCGVLLNNESQNKLKKNFAEFVPDNWTFKCRHMTIDPFKEHDNPEELGKNVDLMVTHFGKNDKACAVKVIGYKGTTNNAFPHVTIAVNELNGGKAKDSNTITEWIPITQHIVLSGTIENISYSPLNETPVTSYTTIGFDDDKRKSFHDPKDFALVKNPVNIEKVKKMFKNSNVDFDLYFVNATGLRRFNEMGSVSKEFLTQSYPEGLGLKPEQFTINDDHITIFYVSNSGDQKIPMTAWTVAHRVGHAIRKTYHFREYVDAIENEFEYLLNDYYNIRKNKDSIVDRRYDLIKGRLFESIGTMRSAREKKLHLRPFEFYYEMLAQNLKDGEIIFNTLPEKLITGYIYGKPQYVTLKNPEDANENLQTLARTASHYINDALGAIVGEIFVM